MKNKSIILLIVLLAGALTLAQAQDGGTVVQGKTLAEKMDWLKVFAQSNTSYIVEINANEKDLGDLLSLTSFGGKENITVTLRGVGANRTLDGTVYVSNVTLVLDNNITLKGATATESGRLIMNAGSTITNAPAASEGVFVYDGGTFIMSGGTISGNTVSGDNAEGGGVSVGRGTFTKTGGTITGYASDQRAGNAVKDQSGAVKNFRGHAVYANANDLLKIREGTAGPGDNIAYDGRFKPSKATGAWDN